MNGLSAFDQTFHDEGIEFLAGVDEAGRGPLAGPVVAAAVIFSDHEIIPDINDSKKLSEKKREEIFLLIKQRALAVSVGIKCNRFIDEHNIRVATLTAMREAVEKLKVMPELVIIDGRDTTPGLELTQKAVVKGDAKSYSIAAASIVAKVIRDRIMHHHDRKNPEYLFARHKGYGTKAHLERIREHGALPIHRFSFRGVLER